MDFFKYNIHFMDRDKYPCVKRWKKTEQATIELTKWLTLEFQKVAVDDPQPWQIRRRKELEKIAALLKAIVDGHMEALQLLVTMQDMIMQNAKEIETLTAIHDN